MPREFHFYVDESGSQDPDRHPQIGSEPDWFGLGGVIIDEGEKESIEGAVRAFRTRWAAMADAPLRSYDIRNRTGGFRWLETVTPCEQRDFVDDLSNLMRSVPIIAHACVIDRNGYNDRFREKYGARRWKLCKTAFNIVVERAAKFAQHEGARLRVFVERSDKATEQRMKSYFDEMRSMGLPFDPNTSAKHRPLSVEELKRTLFEFRVKTKKSALMQLADVALWPLCRGGYDPNNKSLVILRESGKLLDSRCTEANGLSGVKYYCFERLAKSPETQKPA